MEKHTPYYVIDKNKLDLNFLKLKKAVKKHWNNYIIGYSYKTNALPWIIKHFDSLGCYAEVVSEDEYKLAQLIGVEKSRFIYNGPIKTKETFVEALENGCIVNIDSQREIEWLDDVEVDKRNVGVRINFDIEKMCPGQSQCADKGGRFGFCYENRELHKAVEIIKEKKARISGIHLHTSSKSRGLDIYKAISKMACKIQEDFNFKLTYIDVGGGFFGGLDTKPQFDDYLSVMASILSDRFNPNSTTLIIEPGMSVIGAPVSYVTTVIDVKDTSYNRFVITDGSRTNIDPLMTKSSYFFECNRRNELRSNIPKQIICGYTCMEHDRLFELNAEKELLVGDTITYDKVGAYTMCLTPLFIKYFPDVYVKENEKYRLIREGWKPDNYIIKSTLEEK